MSTPPTNGELRDELRDFIREATRRGVEGFDRARWVVDELETRERFPDLTPTEGVGSDE